MPCMCGDLYCPSCGPAQGNWQCPYCGAWIADGGCESPDMCEASADADMAAEHRDYLIDKCLDKEVIKQGVRWAGELDLPADWFSSKHDMPLDQLEELAK